MTSTCSDAGIMAFIRIIKTIFLMIEIVAPIVLIIALAFLAYNLVTAHDLDVMEMNKKKVRTAVRATVLIFLLPVFVSLTMLALGEKFEVSACWKKADNVFNNSHYKNKNNNNKKNTGSYIINPSEYKNNYEGNPNEKYSTMNGTSYSSGNYKGQLFSPETLKIVNEHKDDFNYYNFRSFMAAHGGAGNYIRGLGGVFEKYYGKKVKVKNQAEFHEVCEYVFGLMTIWGFDYKGKSKYCKWGGKCNSYGKASSDAFYPAGLTYNNHGYPNRKDFDALITGKKDLNMTTCCNAAVDMVFYKAGLYTNEHSSRYSSNCKGKVITSLQNARVGDQIHFFKKNITKTNPSTWGNWYHIAFVGEVYADKVVFYDGGSYFTKNRNYKWEAKKTATKVHGNNGNWFLCRHKTIG